MSPVVIRPAITADATQGPLPDVLPDRWRSGGDRRSFVATDDQGRLLGHCRGIDNVFHPTSRTLVLEVMDAGHRDGLPWPAIADALLTAQVAASSLPLHLKLRADAAESIALCARFGGVVVQLMPPWRYVVDGSLRAWADAHRATDDGIGATPAGTARATEMLDLHVLHYTAQHACWSPAAAAAVLRRENAEDFTPATPDAYDPGRSAVLVRDGVLAAQAVVWPPDPDGAHEVALQSWPYEGPTARRDMEACLAAVIDRSDDGEALLVDSHVTERLETAMMREVPQAAPGPDDAWTAIVGIPVPGGPSPVPLPMSLVPTAARGLVEGVRATVPG